LFREEWRALAGMVSAALVSRAAGGSICRVLCHGRSILGATYVDNIAGRRPFHLQHRSMLVSGAPIAHPLYGG
jgi:hypothetical protein